jgi:phi13 family phage major tail protein
MNKVTYGLEQVYIAFKGLSQVESIEVTNECTTDGEITVTVTAATILGTGSPASVVVPLATETHDTAAKVASAVCNAINNDEVIGAAFRAYLIGAVIYLAAKTAAANDATLAIAFTVGSTGVTVGSSTAVVAGTTGWGVPTAIPGAVRFTPSPEDETYTHYADNSAYFVVTSNNGYTAELEMTLIPDAILAEMLGWWIDDNGALIEDANGVPKEFALMGQILGDDKNRRFVYYSCTATRPGKEHTTKGESLEPATDVLNLTILPVDMVISGETKKITRSVLELSNSNTVAYNAFYSSVYLPTVA